MIALVPKFVAFLAILKETDYVLNRVWQRGILGARLSQSGIGVARPRNTRFRLFQNDWPLRPYDRVRRRSYEQDEEILIRGDVNRDENEPRAYVFDNFSVPWVDPTGDRRLKVVGPDGSLTFDVGPTQDNQDQDHSLGFENRVQITALPLGPRGPLNTVWLELVFNDDGMLWQFKSSEGWGDIAAGKFAELADFAAKELIRKLVSIAVPASGGGGGAGGGGAGGGG